MFGLQRVCFIIRLLQTIDKMIDQCDRNKMTTLIMSFVTMFRSIEIHVESGEDQVNLNRTR